MQFSLDEIRGLINRVSKCNTVSYLNEDKLKSSINETLATLTNYKTFIQELLNASEQYPRWSVKDEILLKLNRKNAINNSMLHLPNQITTIDLGLIKPYVMHKDGKIEYLEDQNPFRCYILILEHLRNEIFVQFAATTFLIFEDINAVHANTFLIRKKFDQKDFEVIVPQGNNLHPFIFLKYGRSCDEEIHSSAIPMDRFGDKIFKSADEFASSVIGFITLVNIRGSHNFETIVISNRIKKKRIRNDGWSPTNYNIIRLTPSFYEFVYLDHATDSRTRRVPGAPVPVVGHLKHRKTGVFWWSEHKRYSDKFGDVKIKDRIIEKIKE